jgi:hypothetical protein
MDPDSRSASIDRSIRCESERGAVPTDALRAPDGPPDGCHQPPEYPALEVVMSGSGAGEWQASAQPGVVAPTAAERERFATILRAAVGSGILSLEEFESRLDAVYAAPSLPQLEELVRWLPLPSVALDQAESRRRPTAVLSLIALVALVVTGLILLETRGSRQHPQVNPAGPNPAVAYGPSNSSVPPVVTGESMVTSPSDGRLHARIYITWPPHTRSGYIESVASDIGTAPVESVVDPAGPFSFPMSYQATACFTSTCSNDGSSPHAIMGPWYRPKVDGALLAAALAAPEVIRDPSASAYDLTMKLGQAANAPVIAIWRNGAVVMTLDERLHDWRCGADALCYDDNVQGVTDRTLSYAVSACYSDCFSEDIQNGFAQGTVPSLSVSVPGLAATGSG